MEVEVVRQMAARRAGASGARVELAGGIELAGRRAAPVPGSGQPYVLHPVGAHFYAPFL